MCLKLLVTRLFAQTLVQAKSIENIEAPHYRSYVRESTGERGIPVKKGQMLSYNLLYPTIYTFIPAHGWYELE